MKSSETYCFKNVSILFPTLLFLLFISTINTSKAQSFDQGLDLYKQDKFKEAASLFSDIDSDKGRLFAGKAYFATGKYITAKAYLNQIIKKSGPNLYIEAQYTTALADFQLGQYGNALDILYQLNKAEIRTKVINDSIRLYHGILNYLTVNQRKNAFQEVSSNQVKYDIVVSSFGKVKYPVAKTLYTQLQNAHIDTSVSAIKEITDILSDSKSYAVKKSYSNTIKSPEGITYNIGAALPSYSNDVANFEVAQGLYFGYILAAEKFNKDHSTKKAFIRYQNTGVDVDSSDYTMADLAWNFNADAVLGPLFSKSAKSMIKRAEQYQIPLITPLANSDSLNIDNPYVYQVNPTFASHGRKMARYAVRQLGMDTLAVLAESNSLGKMSAFAFRDEAEKMGAKVVYFFVDNLKARGYELNNYVKYFTTDPQALYDKNYHQLDGVYAPFTGQGASTLIDLLLAELNGMNSTITVLGSQEWGKVDIPASRLRGRALYFSESYYQDAKSPQVARFKKDFMQRFDTKSNRFAMIGYDAATYVLRTLDKVENPALLKNALKEQPLYHGLISNIDFKGTHVNQEVKIFRRTPQGSQPVIN